MNTAMQWIELNGGDHIVNWLASSGTGPVGVVNAHALGVKALHYKSGAVRSWNTQGGEATVEEVVRAAKLWMAGMELSGE